MPLPPNQMNLLNVNTWKGKLKPLKVRKCWLAMPLGAGIQCWVPYNKKNFKKLPKFN